MGRAAPGDLHIPRATARLLAIPVAVALADEVLRVKEIGPAVSDAVAAERAPIVGERCDRLAAGLKGLAVDVVSLFPPRAASAPYPLRQRLDEFAQQAGESLARIQQAIGDPEANALGETLATIAATWGSAAKVHVSLDISPAVVMTGEYRAALSESLREALQNVESHAQASRVRVSLQSVQKRLKLCVADNGVGFLPPADLLAPQPGTGGGLAKIAQRMRRLGGSLAVKSWPGCGTCLLVDGPLPCVLGQPPQPALSPSTARIDSSEGNRYVGSGLRSKLEQVPGIEIVAEGADALDAMGREGDRVYLLLAYATTPGDVIVPRSREDSPDGPPPACDLTARECEILKLIAEGLSNRQIAAHLVISPKTVKNHIWNLYRRMGVRERGQAVSRWRELGQRTQSTVRPKMGILCPPRQRHRRQR